MKNLLEIIMPASLTAVVGAIVVCLFTLGDHLTPEPISASEEGTFCGIFAPAPDSAIALTFLPGQDPAAVAAGDALFKGNCAPCHAVNEAVVGPALAGIRKRRSEKWLRNWVKNSGKLVAQGDEYAMKIFTQYQQQQMPSFALSDQEISQILDYIEATESRTIARADYRPQ